MIGNDLTRQAAEAMAVELAERGEILAAQTIAGLLSELDSLRKAWTEQYDAERG